MGCTAALVPLAPALPSPGLDEGWAAAVNEAVRMRLGFGRELVFTFGPYASAYTRFYHPATDGLMLGSTGLFAVALAAGLTALTAARHRWVAVLLAVFLSQMWMRDPLFFLLSLVFLAVAAKAAEVPRPGRLRPALPAALILLALALAVLPLVKGSFTAGAAAALGLGGALLCLREQWRLALLLGGGAAVALPLAWLLTGQALADLPRFFAAQALVVAGYPEAMGLSGPLWQAPVFAGFAALILLLHLRVQAVRGLSGLALLLGATGLLFLVFKAGFVRQDEHVAMAAGGLALFAWVLLLGRPGWRPVAALAAGLAGWVVLDRAVEPLTPALVLDRARDGIAAPMRGLAARLRADGALRRAYNARLDDIRARHPLPSVTGTVDIYSVGQVVLLAHGLPWRPRPILQSYSAYTAALARMNADHLAGPRAPDTVLFAAEPVDHRVAAQEDATSWPLLLTRYEPVAMRGLLASLRRRDGPVAETTLGPPVLAGRRGLGEVVPLPTDQGPLWATIRVKPTLLGRLVGLLFHPSALTLTFRTGSGRVEPRRFLPGIGEAGFLIAPLVEDAEQFLSLEMPGTTLFADRVPTSFVLDNAWGAGRLWRAGVDIELRPLSVPAQPAVRAALLHRPEPVTPAPEPGDTRCYLDIVDGTTVNHAAPLRLREEVRAVGWGFVTAAGGLEPATVGVTLTAPDGGVLRAPARFLPRPDVGVHFGLPHLARVGFHALLDLQGITGSYRLGLEMEAGGRRWACPLFHAPLELTGR